MPNSPAKIITLRTIGNIFIVLISLILVFKVLSPIFYSTIYSFRTFISVDGNFDKIRESSPRFASIQDAKAIIPAGSTDKVFPSERGFVHIAVRYWLYPVLLTDKGSYLLDFTGKLKSTGRALNVHLLFPKGQIYAKQGSVFHKPQVIEYPQVRPLAAFLLFLILNISAGSIVMRSVFGKPRSVPVSWYLATSYLVGFLILNAAIWLFLLAGGRLSGEGIVLVWSFLILLLFVIFRTKSNGSTELNIPAASHPDITGHAFKVLSLIIAVSILITCVFNPVTNWDAMSHWLLKSKIFFYQQTLNLDYSHHNYYPLLWSLNIASQYTLVGGVFDELAQWTTGVFFIILLCQLRWVLGCLQVPSKIAWLSVLLYLIVSIEFNVLPAGGQVIMSTFNTGIPENGLLAYLTAALILIILWLRNPMEERYLVLAVVFAAGMAMMKLEGAVIAGFIGVALFVTAKFRRWSTAEIRPISRFFYILLIPLLWFMWVQAHGYMHHFYHARSGLSFEKLLMVGQLAMHNPSLRKISFVCFFVLVSFFLIKRTKPWDQQDIFLLLLNVFLVLFSYAAILGWPMDVIQRDGVEVVKRLFCHALPSLILLWASRMS